VINTSDSFRRAAPTIGTPPYSCTIPQKQAVGGRMSAFTCKSSSDGPCTSQHPTSDAAHLLCKTFSASEPKHGSIVSPPISTMVRTGHASLTTTASAPPPAAPPKPSAMNYMSSQLAPPRTHSGKPKPNSSKDLPACVRCTTSHPTMT
jgi:hypothetical protein